MPALPSASTDASTAERDAPRYFFPRASLIAAWEGMEGPDFLPGPPLTPPQGWAPCHCYVEAEGHLPTSFPLVLPRVLLQVLLSPTAQPDESRVEAAPPGFCLCGATDVVSGVGLGQSSYCLKVVGFALLPLFFWLESCTKWEEYLLCSSRYKRPQTQDFLYCLVLFLL